eukprot:GILK01001907.1.p1 GENE.GILK01001907.1~~GILK01001907.1.p1  ORF type:complete len:296 (-),score=46.44 GILK01001907.1:149-997(-)
MDENAKLLHVEITFTVNDQKGTQYGASGSVIVKEDTDSVKADLYSCLALLQEQHKRLQFGAYDVMIPKAPSGRPVLYSIAHLPLNKLDPMQPPIAPEHRWIHVEKDDYGAVIRVHLEERNAMKKRPLSGSSPDDRLGVAKKIRCASIGDWKKKIEAVKERKTTEGGRLTDICKMMEWSQPRMSEAVKYLGLAERITTDKSVDKRKRADILHALTDDSTPIKQFKRLVDEVKYMETKREMPDPNLLGMSMSMPMPMSMVLQNQHLSTVLSAAPTLLMGPSMTQ